MEPPVRNAALASWLVLVPGMLLLTVAIDRLGLAAGWGEGYGAWSLVFPPLAVLGGGCTVAILRQDGRYVRGTYIGLLLGLLTVILLFMVAAAVIGQES